MVSAMAITATVPVETGISTVNVQERVIQIACNVKELLTTAMFVSPGIGEGIVPRPAGQVV